MTLEDSIMGAIRYDYEIGASIEGRFFAPDAAGEPPNDAERPEFPWMAWKELPSTPLLKGTNNQARIFQLFVYDEMGRWSRINRLLNRARNIWLQMAPFTTVDGLVVMDIEWQGLSGTLPADGYGGSVRFGTIRVIVSD